MVSVYDSTTERPRHPEKAARPDTPLLKKPDWIRVRMPSSPVYAETREIVKSHGLVTVCEEARCPNIGECWSQKHATMMIMGDTCTRACAFCNVATGMPKPLDATEPARVIQRRPRGRIRRCCESRTGFAFACPVRRSTPRRARS